jgi:hypothetical protein
MRPHASGLPVTSRRHIMILASALSVFGGVCGCADGETSPPAAGEQVVQAATAAAGTAPNQNVPPGAEVEVTPTTVMAGPADSVPTEAAKEAATEPYTPPFPDRVDLFVAPKRQGGGGQSHDSSERAVELMGFIRVDRSRAILSINGQVSSIAEGETVEGIEVISVQPPSVLLKRGRQRWQATIE